MIEMDSITYDRRPRYPEAVAVQVPRGTRDRLRQIAQLRESTVTDLLRSAIERLVTSEGQKGTADAR